MWFSFILASYSLLSLNVHATKHCIVCGAGKYIEVMNDISNGFPVDGELQLLNARVTIPDDLSSYTSRLLNKEGGNQKENLLKCSGCAHLLYINGMYDELNKLTLECKCCRPVHVARGCACLICAFGSGALGTYICSLANSPIGLLIGCCYYASSFACCMHSCCSGLIEYNTVDDIKDKIRIINLHITKKL